VTRKNEWKNSRQPGEEENHRRRPHFEEVSPQDIWVGLFARSLEREKFLKDYRIKTYKDHLLERTEEDIIVEDYFQPLGEGEYSDYTCSEYCGCDFIPARDRQIVNRHHFHYRDCQNNIRWCCLTEPIANEKLPIAEFGTLRRPLREINYMLVKTYPCKNSIFSTVLLADYTPRSFEGWHFSLQLQSLLAAREYLRQVLSTLNLSTYHYREFLYLQNLLTSRLGVAPDIAKLVLPSLKEPRFLVIPSAIPYFPYRASAEGGITFGIRDVLGGLPPRFVNNGVFHSKFELWQLLFELIVYEREPKTHVALTYLHRLYRYLRKLETDTDAVYTDEDFLQAKKLAHIACCEAEQVGNITELACYRRLV